MRSARPGALCRDLHCPGCRQPRLWRGGAAPCCVCPSAVRPGPLTVCACTGGSPTSTRRSQRRFFEMSALNRSLPQPVQSPAAAGRERARQNRVLCVDSRTRPASPEGSQRPRGTGALQADKGGPGPRRLEQSCAGAACGDPRRPLFLRTTSFHSVRFSV